MNNNNDSNSPSTSNHRVPRLPYTPKPHPSGLVNNITPSAATTQGKTILCQLATNTAARLLHPGLIFPHPNKPNRFTLMCCRSAYYKGKICTFVTCNFFHFPTNLNTVNAEIKAKLVAAWVASQPSVEWTSTAAISVTPTAGNSNSHNQTPAILLHRVSHNLHTVLYCTCTHPCYEHQSPLFLPSFQLGIPESAHR